MYPEAPWGKGMTTVVPTVIKQLAVSQPDVADLSKTRQDSDHQQSLAEMGVAVLSKASR